MLSLLVFATRPLSSAAATLASKALELANAGVGSSSILLREAHRADGVIHDGDAVFFSVPGTGNAVTAEANGNVQTHWKDFGSWQRFVVERAAGEGQLTSGDEIFLRAWTGKLLTVQDKDVHVKWDDRGSWQKLVIETKAGGPIRSEATVFLKGHTGLEMDGNSGDKPGEVHARFRDKGSWQEFVIKLAEAPAQTTTTEVLAPQTPAPATSEEPTADYQYLGCFQDAQERKLPHTAMDKEATPESCSAACAEYKYFGLQYHGQCLCGDGPDLGEELTALGCSTPCRAQPSTMCGGSWRNSVYRINSKAPAAAPTKMPTEAPTMAPTTAPTMAPTMAPTEMPTETPIDAPAECTPEHSLGRCEPCMDSLQCGGGRVCDPYMKKCVASSNDECSPPTAKCVPMCYDGMDATTCQCEESQFPQNWQRPSCGNSTADRINTEAWKLFQLLSELRSRGTTCPRGKAFAPSDGTLKFDCRLWRAAKLHSKDMARQGYFNHTSPDGRGPWARARTQGVHAHGENVAAGHATAQETLDQFLASDAHCRSLLNPAYKSAAVGHTSGGPYGHYWTLMLSWRSGADLDTTCYPPEQA